MPRRTPQLTMDSVPEALRDGFMEVLAIAKGAPGFIGITKLSPETRAIYPEMEQAGLVGQYAGGARHICLSYMDIYESLRTNPPASSNVEPASPAPQEANTVGSAQPDEHAGMIACKAANGYGGHEFYLTRGALNLALQGEVSIVESGSLYVKYVLATPSEDSGEEQPLENEFHENGVVRREGTALKTVFFLTQKLFPTTAI